MTRVNVERAAAMLAERHAADLDPDRVVTAEEWLREHRTAQAADERRWALHEFLQRRIEDVKGFAASVEGWATRHAEAQAAEDAGRAVREAYLGADDDPIESDDQANHAPAEPNQLEDWTEEWLTRHEDAQTADRAGRELCDAYLGDDDEDDAVDDHDPIDIDPAGATAETGRRDVREVAAEEPAPVAEDLARVPDASETAEGVARARRAIAEIRVRTTEDEREAQDACAAELGRWHDHTPEATHNDTDDVGHLDELTGGLDRQPADY